MRTALHDFKLETVVDALVPPHSMAFTPDGECWSPSVRAGCASFARASCCRARFSVRALDVTVGASLLWGRRRPGDRRRGALAYLPRLPSAHAPSVFGLASGSVRVTPGTTRRLRVFAVSQIALSFVLLAGAGTLLAALVALQTANTSYNMRQVLALDVPTSLGRPGAEVIDFYQELMRRIGRLPGVQGVAVGTFVPWRDRAPSAPASSSPAKATRRWTARRTRTAAWGSSRPVSSRCSVSRCWPVFRRRDGEHVPILTMRHRRMCGRNIEQEDLRPHVLVDLRAQRDLGRGDGQCLLRERPRAQQKDAEGVRSHEP